MDRAGRIAQNEVVFREVNERVLEFSDGDPTLEVLCECGDEDCVENLAISREEYERVRADPDQFVVVPGHDARDVETVVSTRPEYVVVRKHESEVRLARKTDPRG